MWYPGVPIMFSKGPPNAFFRTFPIAPRFYPNFIHEQGDLLLFILITLISAHRACERCFQNFGHHFSPNTRFQELGYLYVCLIEGIIYTMAQCPLEKPIIRGTSTIDNNQNEKKVVINVNILSKIYQENNLKKSFDIFFDFIHLKINKIRGSIDSINKIKIPKKTFKNMYIYFQKLCSLN
jgi:hypothetical protein